MNALARLTRRRRPSMHVVITVAAIALLAATVLGLTAFAQNAGPSLAPGHAEVIAEGISSLPASQTVWRAVSYPAKLLAAVPMANRPLGFVLAGKDPILLTNDGTGYQAELLNGEAAFVHDGQAQRRASLGTAAAAYFGLELVASDQTQDIGDGQLIVAGQPFPAPSGPHSPSLVRDVLQPGEHFSMGNPGAPFLVLLTDGSANVRVGGSSSGMLLLGAGRALAGADNLDVAATGTTNADVVVALIGPALNQPATAAPPATAPSIVATTAAGSSQTGSIALLGRHCPAAVNPTALGPLDSCPAYPAGWDITLTGPDGSTRTLADAQVQQVSGMSQAPINAYVWSNLPLGTYTFSAGDITPPAAATFVTAYFDDAPGAPFAIQAGGGYAIPLTLGQPDRKVTIIFGLAATAPPATTPPASPRPSARTWRPPTPSLRHMLVVHGKPAVRHPWRRYLAGRARH